MFIKFEENLGSNLFWFILGGCSGGVSWVDGESEIPSLFLTLSPINSKIFYCAALLLAINAIFEQFNKKSLNHWILDLRSYKRFVFQANQNAICALAGFLSMSALCWATTGSGNAAKVTLLSSIFVVQLLWIYYCVTSIDKALSVAIAS